MKTRKTMLEPDFGHMIAEVSYAEVHARGLKRLSDRFPAIQSSVDRMRMQLDTLLCKCALAHCLQVLSKYSSACRAFCAKDRSKVAISRLVSM